MSSTEIYESKKTGGRLNAPACGLTFFNRNVAAILIVKNQNLDFFVFVCHVPNPLGVDAAVGGRIVCDADIAARRFSAELILQKGEIRALLFGRRDFGKAVIAVDADGVITESGAGEGSHAAARYGDEFAGVSRESDLLVGLPVDTAQEPTRSPSLYTVSVWVDLSTTMP